MPHPRPAFHPPVAEPCGHFSADAPPMPMGCGQCGHPPYAHGCDDLVDHAYEQPTAQQMVERLDTRRQLGLGRVLPPLEPVREAPARPTLVVPAPRQPEPASEPSLPCVQPVEFWPAVRDDLAGQRHLVRDRPLPAQWARLFPHPPRPWPGSPVQATRRVRAAEAGATGGDVSALTPAQRAGAACVRCGRAWLEDLAPSAMMPRPGEPFTHTKGMVVVTNDEDGHSLLACEECPPMPRRVRYWPDGTEVTLAVEEALDQIVAVARRAQAKPPSAS